MEITLIHLADIILFRRPGSEHIIQVCQVLHPIWDARVTLEIKKWLSFTGTEHYWEHVIRCGKSKMATYTFDAIPDLKEPWNVTDPWSLLCSCNAFRHLTQTFVFISDLMDKKLCKSQPQNVWRSGHRRENWNEEATRTTDIAGYPMVVSGTKGKYVVGTDAFDKNIDTE